MTVVPDSDTKKLLGELTREYEANLPSSPAETYLRERGITKETADYFHLGIVLNPRPEERDYEGRLSIPYIVGNSVVGIKYRSLGESRSKYLCSVGFEARRIFNPKILTKLHTKIYVCEGEFDAMTLHQLKVPAIGIPGANAWSPVVARALRHRRVVVLCDGDAASEAGQKASLNFGKQILTSVDGAASITLEGSDVNQYFLDHGASALLEYIGWV